MTAFRHRRPFNRVYYLPRLIYRVYNILTAYPQTAYLVHNQKKRYIVEKRLFKQFLNETQNKKHTKFFLLENLTLCRLCSKTGKLKKLVRSLDQEKTKEPEFFPRLLLPGQSLLS